MGVGRTSTRKENRNSTSALTRKAISRTEEKRRKTRKKFEEKKETPEKVFLCVATHQKLFRQQKILPKRDASERGRVWGFLSIEFVLFCLSFFFHFFVIIKVRNTRNSVEIQTKLVQKKIERAES
jgi:hypothetical protein